jgi:hypothetical protein
VNPLYFFAELKEQLWGTARADAQEDRIEGQ